MNFCDRRKIAKGLKEFGIYFADDNSFDIKRHLQEFLEATMKTKEGSLKMFTLAHFDIYITGI